MKLLLEIFEIKFLEKFYNKKRYYEFKQMPLKRLQKLPFKA